MPCPLIASILQDASLGANFSLGKMATLSLWLIANVGTEARRDEVRAVVESLDDLRWLCDDMLSEHLNLEAWAPVARERFLAAWRELKGGAPRPVGDRRRRPARRLKRPRPPRRRPRRLLRRRRKKKRPNSATTTPPRPRRSGRGQTAATTTGQSLTATTTTRSRGGGARRKTTPRSRGACMRRSGTRRRARSPGAAARPRL